MNITRELRACGPFLVLLLPLIWLADYQRPAVRQARLDAALTAAVHSHNESAALEALTQGANPNARDYYRPKPTLLIRLRHPDAAKGDDEIHAEEWEPVLMSAVIFGGIEMHTQQNDKIAQALLKHGANINARDFRGESVLSCAAGQGRLDLTRNLLDQGAAVNGQDQNGFTPLMNTGFPPSLAITHLLLRHGANPNLQNCDGDTALMQACSYRRADIVQLLLISHANLKLRDHHGRTALQQELARHLPDPVLLHLLQYRRPKPATSSRKTPCPSSRSFQSE